MNHRPISLRGNPRRPEAAKDHVTSMQTTQSQRPLHTNGHALRCHQEIHPGHAPGHAPGHTPGHTPGTRGFTHQTPSFASNEPECRDTAPAATQLPGQFPDQICIQLPFASNETPFSQFNPEQIPNQTLSSLLNHPPFVWNKPPARFSCGVIVSHRVSRFSVDRPEALCPLNPSSS